MRRDLFAICLSLPLSFVSFGQSKSVLEQSEIPPAILSYVKENLPDYKLKRVIKEVSEEEGIQFEAQLNRALEIEFNMYFDVVEVESKKGIPGFYINAEIAKYLAIHHPMIQVIEIDFYADGSRKVTLKKGDELYFDQSGRLMNKR